MSKKREKRAATVGSRAGGQKGASGGGKGRISGGASTGKSGTKKKQRNSSRPAAAIWKNLKKKGDGCAAMLVVGEQVGGTREDAESTCSVPPDTRKTGPDGRAANSGSVRVGGAATVRACAAFAALGHTQRARVLIKLLEGPATYRALQRLTKLKAGPLYHHVNQMRLAGLILPKQRDLYELTRGGRNLILAAMVTGPLIRDKRRRPQPKR